MTRAVSRKPPLPAPGPARQDTDRAVRPSLRREKALLRAGATAVVGTDEVGRGSLAGPVSVGMVCLTGSIGRVPPGLADSKQLSPAQRARLVPSLERWSAAWAVGHASAQEIDALGIIGALCLAGARAYADLGLPGLDLGTAPVIVLDGNYDWLSRPTRQPSLFAPTPEPPSARVVTQVKADQTCASVAAASVIAKVARDAVMAELALGHPGYGFETHAGYGTVAHRAALERLGPSSVHRQSWNLTGAT